MKRKYSDLGSGVLLLALIAWFFVVSLLAGLILALLLRGGNLGIYGMYAFLGVSELLLAVPLIAYMAVLKVSPRALLGNRANIGQILFAALFGVLLVPGLMGLDALVSFFFGSIGVQPTDTSFMEPQSLGAMFAGFLAIGVTAGAVEEPLFRGAALRGLGSAWGRRAAIVVTALAFSLFHIDAVGFLERFLIGVMLGYMAWRSGALLPGMCAHAAFNSAALGLGLLLNTALKDWNGFFSWLSPEYNQMLTYLLVSLPFAAAAWGAYRLFVWATPASATWSVKPYAAGDTRTAGIAVWTLVLFLLLALTVLFAVLPLNGLMGGVPGISQ